MTQPTEQTRLATPLTKSQPVASNAENRLTLSGIGLSVLRGSPGAWQFEGVGGGAYVMCRQETDLGAPIAGPKWIRYGRTTWQGWVVEVEEENLDQEVPQMGESNGKPLARNDLMLLYPDEEYRLFWSFEREHFMQVKAELEQGAHDLEPEKVQSLKFDFVRLMPQNLTDLDLLPWLLETKKLDEHCRGILATHLLSAQRGYIRQSTTDPKGAVAMIDATPTPLRALLLAEFLQWYALHAAERSGSDLTALYRAASLIKVAESGAPDAAMEAAVSERYAQLGTPERAMFEKYRVYAWKCAAAEIRGNRFLDTLPTRLNQVSGPSPDLRWEGLARGMMAETARSSAGPAEHPGLDSSIQSAPVSERGNRRLKVLLSTVGLSLVRGYFDLYTLGRRLTTQVIVGRDALPSTLSQFDAEWEQARNTGLPQSCGELLARAPYPDFVSVLRQVEGNPYRRLPLLERYLDACALADHRWWKSLDESREIPAEASLWKQLSPSIKWMSRAFKSSGKTLSSLVQARLAAYSLSFQEAQALLEALFRHEISLTSPDPVDPQVHYLSRTPEFGKNPNFSAKIQLRNGTLTVSRDVPVPEAPESVSFRLLRRLDRPPASPALARSPQNAYELAEHAQRTFSPAWVVPADLAELKQRHSSLPAGFAHCAEIVNLTLVAVRVAEELRRGEGLDKPLETTWELTSGVIAVVDSHRTALQSLQRPLEASRFLDSSKLTRAKLASSVFGGIAGALSVGKAAKLLFCEEGDLAYELRQGRSGRAGVHAVTGMLQIAQGTLGLLAAVPATAPLAATPIALAIVIGAGMVIATLDVALDATQEFTDHVDGFQRAVDEAVRTELQQQAFRCSITARTAIDRVKTAV